jgi:predicted RNA-binding protein
MEREIWGEKPKERNMESVRERERRKRNMKRERERERKESPL